MTGWLDDYVFANGIRIHYTRTNGTKPPLLLLHGLTDNGLCWTRVARAMEGAYDVIMLDARGHGLSDGPETGFSLRLLAEDVAGLIRVLELGQVTILGHSMGAATAAQVAADSPELLRAILLEDPPWNDTIFQTGPDEEYQTPEHNPWLQWLLPLRKQTVAERIAIEHTRSNWTDEELLPWAQSKDQLRLAVVQRNLDIALGTTSWRELVPRIQCPILLITGDPERGAIIPPQRAQELTHLWQHGQVAHILGAGHNIRRDQYDLFMAAVTQFLSSLPQ